MQKKSFGILSVMSGLLMTSTVLWAAQNQVSITQDGTYRYIRSNGIPDHSTGHFPNAGNPNTISEQDYHYRVPLNPQFADHITSLELGLFGVAVNGIPFDPGAAEFWNNDGSSGWQYEALSGYLNLGMDQNNAHVQPNGAYHYHGLPMGLIRGQSANRHSDLIGYAADGFPIYARYGYVDPENPDSGIKELKSSYHVKNGTRPNGPGGKYDGRFVQDYAYRKGAGDLDECNGRIGVTPDYPAGIYAYYITSDFPFVPRCFKGTPDSSFSHHGGQGGPGGQVGQGRRPPPGGRPPHPPHDRPPPRW